MSSTKMYVYIVYSFPFELDVVELKGITAATIPAVPIPATVSIRFLRQ